MSIAFVLGLAYAAFALLGFVQMFLSAAPAMKALWAYAPGRYRWRLALLYCGAIFPVAGVCFITDSMGGAPRAYPEGYFRTLHGTALRNRNVALATALKTAMLKSGFEL